MSTSKRQEGRHREKDIHRLTEGSKSGDHEDDETGEEAERAGTSQAREV